MPDLTLEFDVLHILSTVTGYPFSLYDVAGRQGVPDGLLLLPRGGLAAVEITQLGSAETFELLGRLTKERFQWLLPPGVRKHWRAMIAPHADYPRARAAIGATVEACERFGVWDPSLLPRDARTDPEVAWLASAREIHVQGRNEAPSLNVDGHPVVHVVPLRLGDLVERALSGLGAYLEALLRGDSLQSKIAKLRGFEAACERHLVLLVGHDGLPPPMVNGLVFGDQLPQCAPPSLGDLDALWILHRDAARLLNVSIKGWGQCARPSLEELYPNVIKGA